MVSFWPWKGDDKSPASFEKTLVQLSTRIDKITSRQDSFRQNSRRYTALLTLYGVFAYLLCAAILILVVGWRNWTAVEFSGILGGPVILYVTRLTLTRYYALRLSKLQMSLDGLEKQRDATITRLKAATRYDTTQELLNKYGGTPTPKSKTKESTATSPLIQPNKRTSFIPPPTANIRLPTPHAHGPQGHGSASPPPPQWPDSPHTTTVNDLASLEPTAEFAPSAFPSPPQYAPSTHNSGLSWTDRILDLLMGEDESLPGKRIALICHKCRLVNGQAPPGARTLSAVGRWRCGECRAWNGEEDVAETVVHGRKVNASMSDGDGSGVESGEVDDGVKDNGKVKDEAEDEDVIELSESTTTTGAHIASLPQGSTKQATRRSARARSKKGNEDNDDE